MPNYRERDTAEIVPPAFRERRKSAMRPAPQAGFLSQVLADARGDSAPAPVSSALASYSDGAAITVRRLPPGYRRTVVA